LRLALSVRVRMRMRMRMIIIHAVRFLSPSHESYALEVTG
jgi:hypothetical protein